MTLLSACKPGNGVEPPRAFAENLMESRRGRRIFIKFISVRPRGINFY